MVTSDVQRFFICDENTLMQFGDPGTAPVLNYNIPQPLEYHGCNYIELELDNQVWNTAAYEWPPTAVEETNIDTTPTADDTLDTSGHGIPDNITPVWAG